MAVSENKKRFSITLNKDIYEILKEKAQENKRTLSNEIELLIEKEYLKKGQ